MMDSDQRSEVFLASGDPRARAGQPISVVLMEGAAETAKKAVTELFKGRPEGVLRGGEIVVTVRFQPEGTAAAEDAIRVKNRIDSPIGKSLMGE